MSQSNPALWFTRPLECPSSAFVTLYHHYFPSPISGIYTPLPSLSSQQNLHSFFSTQLESPSGRAPHSSFCSINHTEDRFPPWYSEFNFFTFLPPSLLSTSLGARTSVSPRTKAPEKQMLRNCVLTFVALKMMNHDPHPPGWKMWKERKDTARRKKS